MMRVNRRVFLRGAGTVAIGLPLAASIERYGLAQESVVPDRYLTLYFGNGVPKKFADQGYDGPLSPLAPHASKLAMLRDMVVPLNESPGDLHWMSTERYGVGLTPDTNTGAVGESLDNAIYGALDPARSTRLLNMTMHGRAEGNPASRVLHSWAKAKIPNASSTDPHNLFEAIFGAPTVREPDDSPEATRAARHHNSVLDSVLDQYRHITGERSGYSAGVRAQIADHLDLVRQLERRASSSAAGATSASGYCFQEPPEAPPEDLEPIQFCTASSCPTEMSVLFGDDDTANWNEVWPLMCELYATALRCGSTRFGTVGCTGSGDRYPIPELAQRGVTDSAHILAHEWTRGQENGFDLCVEWLVQKIALFLSHLDDPAWPDPNGGTVLDNTLMLIGTELGTATDGQHAVNSMTYWLAGAEGLLRPGTYDLSGRTDVDLYSSIARVMGAGTLFGDPADFNEHLDLFTI